MHGLVMNTPLLVSSLIQHADRHHGDTEIVSRRAEGDIHRYTYRDCHRRSRQLANALAREGMQRGDRVGTLAWNGYRHMEIYYGASGSGVVCHTINPRLFAEHIVYIVNHAEDRILFFDVAFLPLITAIAPQLKTVKLFVPLCDRGAAPETTLANAVGYEDFIARESDEYEWPTLDEQSASSLCYSSGTTGRPKGVLYSHRSTILHAYAAALPDAMNLSARDCVLPVVPMFHANAWGIPYTCPLMGSKLVFPGAALDGKSLLELFEREGVTFSAGVPTVWMGLLAYMRQTKSRFSTLRRTIIGGAACPPAMMRELRDDFDVEVRHAWGMTEMSPLGTVSTLKHKHESASETDRDSVLAKQGRVVYGVDIKIVDEHGEELPWDGTVFGDLLVRGPWIASDYFKSEEPSPLRDGWFPTGDVATIDPDGYIKITDRSKDVIKSGGEWISSIDLENIAMAHPAVQEAAVIGVKHAQWGERPLLVVVPKPGATCAPDELLCCYEGRTVKWWRPDGVVFVDELPHTATGKLHKVRLREQLAHFAWPE